jgi:hypothetical protein
MAIVETRKMYGSRQQINTPVEMMRACPVGLMLAFAHGSILTLAS